MSEARAARVPLATPDSAPAVAGRIGPAPATAGSVVDELARLLERAGIPLAPREARDLVAAVLDVPRLWPATNRSAVVGDAAARAARAAAAKRARGAPFAYAVGRAAFRHLTLDVDERVLIPRQETELLVEHVLSRASGGVVVDVGTGSGAIALSLATEGRFARVVATDVSLDALAVAARNVERLAGELRAPIELRHGALLAPVRDLRARALVSNPPYIADAEAVALPASVRDWEPPVALFGGDAGMDATAALVRAAPEVLEPGGLLALEVDERRAALVAALARGDGRYRGVTVERDLTGRERFVLAVRADGERRARP